jgi:hypothetical protein
MSGCKLCAYSGSKHPIFDEIMCYVADNAHSVHINELASHAKSALEHQLEIDMTTAAARSVSGSQLERALGTGRTLTTVLAREAGVAFAGLGRGRGCSAPGVLRASAARPAADR